MSEHEILYKILDEVSKANTKIAVVQTKQDAQIAAQKELLEKHEEVAKSHYKLKNDFGNHKSRFLWITGIGGSFFGAVGTYFWNLFIGKH